MKDYTPTHPQLVRVNFGASTATSDYTSSLSILRSVKAGERIIRLLGAPASTNGSANGSVNGSSRDSTNGTANGTIASNGSTQSAGGAAQDAGHITPTQVKRYTSVQVAADAHIELNSDFVYMNHSCAPTVDLQVAPAVSTSSSTATAAATATATAAATATATVTATATANGAADGAARQGNSASEVGERQWAGHIDIIARRDLFPGDELTFFYPVTEWEMDQPFDCFCTASASDATAAAVTAASSNAVSSGGGEGAEGVEGEGKCLGSIRGAKYIDLSTLQSGVHGVVNDHVLQLKRAQS